MYMNSATAVRIVFFVHAIAALFAYSGCVKHQISFFSETAEPLKEYTLQGAGKEKLLMIPVKGTISDSNKDLSLSRKPGMVQTIVSQLRKAEKDKDIKAVIVEIDSPGGSVTASDMLYHEFVQFKERSGVKLTAVMMGVAASGGYYIALPSDYIWAHPTSITGSIGVIFLRPNLSGLMGKIGLEVEVDKSGKNKDMGSPFRKATGEEQHIVQGLIDEMAGRFLSLVVTHRKLSDETKSKIASARIYAADEALRLGLVDQVGYLDDAIQKTAQIAGLPENPKVIVYRRSEVADDNFYNTTSSKTGIPDIHLIDLGLADSIPPLRSGFYYLWLPGQLE
jgi:protease IV